MVHMGAIYTRVLFRRVCYFRPLENHRFGFQWLVAIACFSGLCPVLVTGCCAHQRCIRTVFYSYVVIPAVALLLTTRKAGVFQEGPVLSNATKNMENICASQFEVSAVHESAKLRIPYS